MRREVLRVMRRLEGQLTWRWSWRFGRDSAGGVGGLGGAGGGGG
jgi:hypothetical protein